MTHPHRGRRCAAGIVVALLAAWTPVAASAQQADPGFACHAAPGFAAAGPAWSGDATTGLLWLELPRTVGWSFEEARTRAPVELLPGWRHATGAELCSRFADAGLPVPSCPGPDTASTAGDVLASFRSRIGTTIDAAPVALGAAGFFEDGGAPETVGVAPFWWSEASGQSFASVQEAFTESDRVDPGGLPTGSYLVRSSACADGVDNDGDGAIDGGDPGCSGLLDDNEGLEWRIANPSVPGLFGWGLAVDASSDRIAAINLFASFLLERNGDAWLPVIEDAGDGLGVAVDGDLYAAALNLPGLFTFLNYRAFEGGSWPIVGGPNTGGSLTLGNCTDCIAIDDGQVAYRHGDTEVRVSTRVDGVFVHAPIATELSPVSALDFDVGRVAIGLPLDATGGAVRIVGGDAFDVSTTLLPPAGASPRFGANLALRGDVLAIASEGAVHLFRETGAGFVFEQRIDWDCEALGDVPEVAVSGDFLLVAQPGCFEDAGAAFVYRFDGASWQPDRPLAACDTIAGDRFGTDIALHGGLAVLGANGAAGDGLVYAFDLELPACADGIDNDGDGVVDAADPQCADADDRNEGVTGSACGLGPEIAALVALLGAARRYASSRVRVQ